MADAYYQPKQELILLREVVEGFMQYFNNNNLPRGVGSTFTYFPDVIVEHNNVANPLVTEPAHGYVPVVMAISGAKEHIWDQFEEMVLSKLSRATNGEIQYYRYIAMENEYTLAAAITHSHMLLPALRAIYF